MTYDRECTESAERIFGRVHSHLLSVRDTVGNLDALDCSVAAENNALLNALLAGDPVMVESVLYDMDHEEDA